MTIGRTAAVLAFLLGSTAAGQAQGLNGTPEFQAQQAALERTYPQMNVTDEYMHLSVPGYTMGETMGVATNSKGHLFVYSRTDPLGIARGGHAAMLWEFDQNGKFVKEWAPHNYAAAFAHAVRVDRKDDVWQVDEGSGMIVEYNPKGQQIFWLGRTPEAIDYLEQNLEILKYAHPMRAVPPKPVGRKGTFDRETDVAWDSQGNIFVSDGYGNSRVVKISPDGHWLKMVGTNGSGQDQFKTPHAIAVDAQNNVYVADRGNFRIQVYDDNLNYERTITGIGAPWGICISDSSPQYMYSGDGNGKLYKMDMTGKVLGMTVTGQDHGEEDTGDLIHSVDCRNPNVVYIGSASMYDVQKLTIK
ncbi:MAG: peptidyl-alpha-hydroxyglycine alpha-amidating lyase family protein [Rhizomicrobium sp.]